MILTINASDDGSLCNISTKSTNTIKDTKNTDSENLTTVSQLLGALITIVMVCMIIIIIFLYAIIREILQSTRAINKIDSEIKKEALLSMRLIHKELFFSETTKPYEDWPPHLAEELARKVQKIRENEYSYREGSWNKNQNTDDLEHILYVSGCIYGCIVMIVICIITIIILTFIINYIISNDIISPILIPWFIIVIIIISTTIIILTKRYNKYHHTLQVLPNTPYIYTPIIDGDELVFFFYYGYKKKMKVDYDKITNDNRDNPANDDHILITVDDVDYKLC